MMDRFQKAWRWHTLKIFIVLKKRGKKDKCHCRESPFSKPRCYIPVLEANIYL